MCYMCVCVAPLAEDEEPKSKCKKAKLLRLERRKAKMEKRGNSEQVIETKQVNKEKSLEDYLNEVSQENSAKKLEVRSNQCVSFFRFGKLCNENLI